MTKKEMIKLLNRIYDDLDKIQETPLFQKKENEEEMWELGETIGNIDNLIDFVRGEEDF